MNEVHQNSAYGSVKCSWKGQKYVIYWTSRSKFLKKVGERISNVFFIIDKFTFTTENHIKIF